MFGSALFEQHWVTQILIAGRKLGLFDALESFGAQGCTVAELAAKTGLKNERILKEWMLSLLSNGKRSTSRNRQQMRCRHNLDVCVCVCLIPAPAVHTRLSGEPLRGVQGLFHPARRGRRHSCARYVYIHN